MQHLAAERDGDSLPRLLRAYVRRSRWQTMVTRGIEAFTIVLVGMCGLAVVHQMAPLPSLVREIAADLLGATAIARGLPAVARLLNRKIDYVAAAERLERCRPDLQQRLSTSMSCRARGESSGLVHELAATLELELIDQSEFLRQCLPWHTVGRRAAIAVGLALAAIVLAVILQVGISVVLPPWP